MALADTVHEKHEPCSCEYSSSVSKVEFRLANLQVSYQSHIPSMSSVQNSDIPTTGSS